MSKQTARRGGGRIKKVFLIDKLTMLKQYFGHAQFRPGQEELIDAILSGRDVLGVMPTGAGKSVCYQLPAMMLPGLTLVISPLISLMKDQVAALEQSQIPAACINSSLSLAEYDEVYRRAEQGAYKLLYVAPERLGTEDFLAFVRGVQVSFVAVDEAHCVSQWGQDFRPSYLAIADFIALFPKRPAVGAFTATATELVRSDIERLLCLKDPVRVVTGFDRPNLFYEVKTPKDKLDALLHFAAAHEEQSGIVYCSTRKTVEQVHAELVHYGFSAARYHAGLSDGERAKAQEDFRFDRVRLIVATNAFGMGIDKSNVSYVLHYNMPQSPEAYYQEAGRAGRDGENAQCVLYFSTRDVVTARWLIRHRAPNEALTAEQAAALQKQDEVRLQKMVDYCETSACLRGALLDYFGQKHPLRCNACANCKKARETAAFLLRPLPAPAPAFGMRDVSREAAAFLAGISKMGSGVRCAFAVKMLQKNAQVGTALYEKSDEFLRALAAQLVQSGFVSENEFGGLSVAPRAAEVLRGDVRVFLEEEKAATIPKEVPAAKKEAGTANADLTLPNLSIKALRAAASLPEPLKETLLVRFLRGIRDKQLLSAGLDKNPGFGSCRELSRGGMQELISQLIEREFLRIDARGVVTLTDEGRDAAGIVRPRKKAAGAGDHALFDALKARRYELASAQRIPAYAVFSDATLRDMVKKRPKTPEEFRRVSGVGEVKAARYGKDFLRIIAKFE